MARLKMPATPVPQSRGEAEILANELSGLKRDMERIEADAEAAIAAAKLGAKQATEHLAKRAKAVLAALAGWAEAHRGDLLEPGRKSLRMAAGTLGWRTSPPAVQVEKDWDIDEMEGWLRARGLERFLRERIELDKEALLAEPAIAGTIPGVQIVQAEHLYFRPDEIDSELSLKVRAS